jgi:hypothetical protein
VSDQDVAQDKSIPDGDSMPNQSLGRQHSVTGIASFIIGVFNLVLFGFSGYLGFKGTPFRLIHFLEIAVLCVVPFLWVAGLVLSVIGLFRKKDHKLFSILGLVTSLLYLCPLAFTILGFIIGR